MNKYVLFDIDCNDEFGRSLYIKRKVRGSSGK